MRVVIDTNVLVSAVMDRNVDQQKKADRLFHMAGESQVELLIPQCAIFEFIYVLESRYEVARDDVRAMVRDLINMPSLRVVDDLNSALWLRTWTEPISEPNDAAVAAVAMATRSAVATFDRKLIRQLRALSVEIWAWPMRSEGDRVD